MQQALPTTFGLKAAGWLAGLTARGCGWPRSSRRLPVQYGGAAGTLVGARPARASRCGRRSPRSWTWPTPPCRGTPCGCRSPISPARSARPPGVLATVAVDVVLLAQTEVGEVAEGGDGRGGSSAMPHKRNPVGGRSPRGPAPAGRPGWSRTLLAAMEQEHERAAGAWHSEWPTLTDLLTTVGSRGVLAGREPVGSAGRIPRAWPPPWPRPGIPNWPARWPRRSRRRSARGPPTTRRPRRRGRRPPAAGRCATCLAERTDVDVDALLAAAAPDPGEAAAQVDAALADHRRLTEGTP